MYKFSRELAQKLDEREIRYDVHENDSISCIDIPFSEGNAKGLHMKFFSPDDDNDFSFVVYGVCRVPEEKRDALLPVVNQANRKYRYMRFLMDDDGDINLEFDCPVKAENPVQIAEEIIARVANQVNEWYMFFMKAILAA